MQHYFPFIQLLVLCFSVVALPCRKSVSAATLKQAWASVVIQRHWRGYRMRQIYQVVLIASITIQAFTRGWMARKRYKKVLQSATSKTNKVLGIHCNDELKLTYMCVSDGRGAEGPGSAEVCQSVAGTPPLPDHAQAGAQRPAVLQSAAAQEEARGAGEENTCLGRTKHFQVSI